MSFLLDTNVVSEPTKPRPNPAVIEWLAAVDEETVFITAITISELRYGIQRLPASARRTRLDSWLRNDLRARFEGRLLAVDAEIADVCGRLIARSEALGRPLELRDAFIAATAEVHDLTLVTRNVSDFQPTVKSIFSPWS